jgi:hypothetical protein
MELKCSSEVSFDFLWTTRRYIPEDTIPHTHRRENLKSKKYIKSGIFFSYFYSFDSMYWTVMQLSQVSEVQPTVTLK